MSGGARRALSHTVGWIADRRIPRPLRRAVYRGYARFTGADLAEVRLPLDTFPSLGAFFVRELVPGARTFPVARDAIGSPVDGTVQSLCPISQGTILQAKGRSYPVAEFLGSLGRDVDLEGGFAWTIYLSPRDYHRIHAPESCRLQGAEWLPGDRWSVAPKVLAKRRVLDVNERCVLRLECERATVFLVLVGALNVGRIRVVGVAPEQAGLLAPSLPFARGAELARFEMGSTIVLLAPRGSVECDPHLREGQGIRMGSPIGRWTS